MLLRFFSLYRAAFSDLQRNIWILSIAMFINRSGSMVLLFTSLYLTRELNHSIETAGIVMSMYGIGSILGSYFGGWLTDRKNPLHVQLASLIICGIVLLLMVVTTSVVLIGAILFLYAFTADIFRPASSASITAYSTTENRTRSVSLMRLAVNLGFTVGPAAGGFIALYLGYKWLFVIDAITSFAAAWMLFKYVKRNPEPARPEKAVLKNRSTSAYRDVPYLLFILLVALYATCFFQIFASIPQYFSEVCHYTEDTIGLLLALNGFIVVVVEMPLIAQLAKRQKIFPYIIAGVLCLPVSFAILYFGRGMMFWALVYTLIITMSEIFAMPFMMNYALSRPVKERQGQYAALYSISYGAAISIAPTVGLGIAGKFNFDTMFLFFIALSMLVALGFAWLKRKG